MANRKNYEFDMLVSAGYIGEHSFNHKFGASPTIHNGKMSSIYDVDDSTGGNLYPWDALDPATNIHITNVGDDENLQVTVQGLDADFNEIEETITLTGTDTAGSVNFHRVNRAFLVNGTNTDNIDIRAGAIAGTIVARITAGMAQTLMAVYTVPAHCTGYLHRGTFTCQAGEGATGFMYVRYPSEDSTPTPFRVGHTFEVAGDGGQYYYDFAFPIPIPSKSDIDIRAIARTNNIRVTAAFDIMLVENDDN